MESIMSYEKKSNGNPPIRKECFFHLSFKSHFILHWDKRKYFSFLFTLEAIFYLIKKILPFLITFFS